MIVEAPGLMCRITVRANQREGSQLQMQAWQAGMQSCNLLISGISEKTGDMKTGAVQV